MREVNYMGFKRFILGITLLLMISPMLARVKNDNQQMLDKLIGTWCWVETTGGIAGVHQTPASTGHTRKLIFNKDLTFQVYEDEKLKSSGCFEIEFGKSLILQKDAFMLKFDTNSATNIIQFDNDGNLILGQDVYDGFVKKYAKIIPN